MITVFEMAKTLTDARDSDIPSVCVSGDPATFAMPQGGFTRNSYHARMHDL